MQPFNLTPELLNYIRHRAERSGLTVQQTLDKIVREAMRYDALVMTMSPDSQPRATKTAPR